MALVSSSTSVKPEDLKGVYLLKDISPQQLARFASACAIVECKASDTIIREGDTGDEMYILLDGTVEISRKLTLLASQEYDELSKTLVMLTAKERPFFGEMGLLGQNERTASVVARTECKLVTIKQADFEELCREDPQMGVAILRLIALTAGERLLKTNKDVMKLTTALCLALEP
jgi:CRP/FNR family cyclic AMP-dependent transcriptional regulator